MDINSLESKLTRSTQIVWPNSTSQGEKRTTTAITRIITEIQENATNTQLKDIKGIIGYSPLIDFQNFDFVNNIPTEYLHSICIGLVKRLLELCFNVGDLRTRITNRKLSSTTKFNEIMTCIRVPREFSRRCRKLDFSVLKAQELRNILLFFSQLFLSAWNQP